MKTHKLFIVILLFFGLIVSLSCSNDNGTPLPDVSQDYIALKALYDANSNNTLGWDFDDISMKSWNGVTLLNDRVIELKLNNKELTRVSNSIGDLSELIKLHVEDNEIEEVSNVVSKLIKLQELQMDHNQLYDLPRDIGKLTTLMELSFVNNPLTVVPQEICNLTLTGTNIQKDELAMFCEGTIADHAILKNFYDQNTQNTLNWGTSIDDISMSNWDGVTVSFTDQRVVELNIFQSGIDTFTSELGDLEHLEILALTFSNITKLPKEIGNLRNLKGLYLTLGFIEELPIEIGQLNNLAQLYIDSNSLKTIPDSMVNLTNIQSIKLNNNNLTTVPIGFGSLEKLEDFNLRDNPLTSLPDDICKMRGVVELDSDDGTNLCDWEF